MEEEEFTNKPSQVKSVKGFNNVNSDYYCTLMGAQTIVDSVMYSALFPEA